MKPKDWAGTTADRHDLHRFAPDQRALCNPAIRTYSLTTPHDATREPDATLRTRKEIEENEFASLYRFCPECSSLPL
ncbi:hypothetical protein GCM10010371_63880 [Streptomyces subrutilus]|uniref:Uncharacterized protein n=1 Tax=Streptomyces subrutilus TaxID=36818 RepID=A0A918RHE8_9ACTN|nr:hypothetical protein [Streptomyces subrutilus]GGZ95178.1 hypothetical protein GCM10010371_63880 [Streptomyces subrutilus]